MANLLYDTRVSRYSARMGEVLGLSRQEMCSLVKGAFTTGAWPGKVKISWDMGSATATW